MRVLELWRYPVKSLQGERLETAEIGPDGVAGDRQWALFDLDTGFGLTARRMPDLLFGSGRLRADGSVEVVLPDGTVTDDDARALRLAGPTGRAAAGERPLRGLRDRPTRARWTTKRRTATTGNSGKGAPGPFHDSPRIRLSLVSTGTLGNWDRRRFRANVLLDGAGEEQWEGREATLGEVRLRFGRQIGRCVMTTRPQPGGIARDTSVLKTIHRERDGLLAVRAAVRSPGTVRIGDELVPADAD